MTTGTELTRLLEAVDPPADSGFSVVEVASAPGYRVGRGVDGALVLLTPPDADPGPPTRLRRLSLDPRLHCRVQTSGRVVDEGDFGVVQLHYGHEEMVAPFLDVIAALVRLLGPEPATGEVNGAMRRLVHLFTPNAPVRGSALGLWAELLTIAWSKDPQALVDAWHAHVDARFDFSAPGSRLEVKATSRDVRAHEFSLVQLLPVAGAVVSVVSYQTTETHAGTSLQDLVSRVERVLSGDSDRQMKVHDQVAAVLGSDWPRQLEHRFDEQQARQSARLFPASDVPSVGDPPHEVLEVRLLVDCTDVRPESVRAGLSALVSLAP